MPEPLIFMHKGPLSLEQADKARAQLAAQLGDRPFVILDDTCWSVAHGDIEGAAKRARDVWAERHMIDDLHWDQLDETTRELWRDVVRAVYGDG